MITREPIYAALFAKLAAVPGLVTTSRKLAHWADVPPGQQPALYMAQGTEVAQTVSGQPTRWTLNVSVYLYVRTTGGLVPASVLNPILDGIEASIKPDISGVQTLGGLVAYCRIDGAIETDEGTLGDQAVAIIPITLFVS